MRPMSGSFRLMPGFVSSRAAVIDYSKIEIDYQRVTFVFLPLDSLSQFVIDYLLSLIDYNDVEGEIFVR